MRLSPSLGGESPPALPYPRLVTFVTHEAPGLEKLKESAAATSGQRGLEVIFTTTRFGPKLNWGPRLLAMHAFVSDEQRCPDERELVAFVDGFGTSPAARQLLRRTPAATTSTRRRLRLNAGG